MVTNLLDYMNKSLWYIDQDYLENKINVIKAKLKDEPIEKLIDFPEGKAKKEGPEIIDGIAFQNIEGELVPKASYLDTICGFTSTFSKHQEFNELVDNPKVKMIVQYHDCPGGGAIGIPEFADSIRKCEKPVIAFTDHVMCSASYYLASGANEIWATPSARVGSIGAVMSMVKVTETKGIKVKYYSAGKGKIFGSPYTPESQEEDKFFQDSIDAGYKEFVDFVSQRKKWTKEQVKEIGAGAYSASQAPVFIDKIIKREELIDELSRYLEG